MTPEARLDRLERVALLLVKAGTRARSEWRERDRDLEKRISHLVDLQIANEELQKQNQKKFAENEERFARNEGKFAGHDERFARHEETFARDEARLTALSEKTDQRFAQLAESQAKTDRDLAELIKIVRMGRNGNPRTES